jgi:hypothetical protein
VGEKRRLSLDFSAYDELDTETLTGTPTVAIDSGSGVTITSASVDGSEVAFWCDCTAAVADAEAGYTEYEVTVAIATTGGADLVRAATLKVEA